MIELKFEKQLMKGLKMKIMQRTITHWTGGGGRANSTDKKHYHKITEFDGNVVDGNEEIEDNIVTSDGDYAAHTRNLNTGSIGLSMAGMLDATEYPLNFGPSPITRVQFEAHCRLLAEIHRSYGIPVTGETCLTHAEVEPTLGVKQNNKWDLTVLEFEPNIRGAIPVGDYMRSRVRAYMGQSDTPSMNYPTIRRGIKGHFVKELQTLMGEIGFFSGKNDGDFGPRTEEAVIAFQSQNGLVADGVVGSKTWHALMTTPERELRDVSMGDLRESGSRTVVAADTGQTAVTVAGVGTVALTALETVTGATDALSTAETGLGTAQAILFEYWPLLAVGVLGLILWTNFNKIKSARLNDAQTGKNMGR